MNLLFKSDLKIGYWNVEGLGLAGDNPKTENPTFVNTVKEHDIMCLAETHCSNTQNIDIQGYKCFKLCRSMTKNSNRYYGGLAVLYKQDIQKGLKFLEHKNNDYVWLKLSRDFFNLQNDMYVCVSYIPPESSPFYKRRGENTLQFVE